jgi:transposase InsO family protein
MARREIQAMLRRYRRVWRLRNLLQVLDWRRPGSVWAVDFAEPPQPIEGCYPYLLAVRDLASGCQLLWLPIADETAATAIAGLRALFQQHGPPMVLKSDNGSAFIDRDFRALLKANEVAHLRSPPETPEYNGSCEAGIGSMKTRTHYEAARHGRPGAWTCDDAEGARLQANQTGRPWGPTGPTPDEGWAQRRSIGAEEHSAFAALVRAFEREARRERGHDEGARLIDSEQAALDRIAITRVLLAHGLLTLRRDGGPQR